MKIVGVIGIIICILWIVGAILLTSVLGLHGGGEMEIQEALLLYGLPAVLLIVFVFLMGKASPESEA